jgi:hypothetical protein
MATHVQLSSGHQIPTVGLGRCVVPAAGWQGAVVRAHELVNVDALGSAIGTLTARPRGGRPSGVYKSTPGAETADAVASALRLGYRHVDTAQVDQRRYEHVLHPPLLVSTRCLPTRLAPHAPRRHTVPRAVSYDTHTPYAPPSRAGVRQRGGRGRGRARVGRAARGGLCHHKGTPYDYITVVHVSYGCPPRPRPPRPDPTTLLATHTSQHAAMPSGTHSCAHPARPCGRARSCGATTTAWSLAWRRCAAPTRCWAWDT